MSLLDRYKNYYNDYRKFLSTLRKEMDAKIENIMDAFMEFDYHINNYGLSNDNKNIIINYTYINFNMHSDNEVIIVPAKFLDMTYDEILAERDKIKEGLYKEVERIQNN